MATRLALERLGLFSKAFIQKSFGLLGPNIEITQGLSFDLTGQPIQTSLQYKNIVSNNELIIKDSGDIISNIPLHDVNLNDVHLLGDIISITNSPLPDDLISSNSDH